MSVLPSGFFDLRRPKKRRPKKSDVIVVGSDTDDDIQILESKPKAPKGVGTSKQRVIGPALAKFDDEVIYNRWEVENFVQVTTNNSTANADLLVGVFNTVKGEEYSVFRKKFESVEENFSTGDWAGYWKAIEKITYVWQKEGTKIDVLQFFVPVAYENCNKCITNARLILNGFYGLRDNDRKALLEIVFVSCSKRSGGSTPEEDKRWKHFVQPAEGVESHAKYATFWLVNRWAGLKNGRYRHYETKLKRWVNCDRQDVPVRKKPTNHQSFVDDKSMITASDTSRVQF